MAKKIINLDAVRKIALTLPGVEESLSWGAPAFKIHGKMMACVPSHRSAEPGSLVVRVDFEDRGALLDEAPEAYYITDHYAGYAGVLVRLSCVTPDMLRDLLNMAYKFVTRNPTPRSSTPNRRSSRAKKSRT